MQLKRGSTALVAALFLFGSIAFALSPATPKTNAAEAPTVTERLDQLAGSFSMLAGDMRALRDAADKREARETARDQNEASRVTAQVIAMQNLTEMVERLTAQMKAGERSR